MTERCEDAENRMSTKIDGVMEAIRSSIRTVIAISALLIALAQLVIVWLR